jgi:hypothetical protein
MRRLPAGVKEKNWGGSGHTFHLAALRNLDLPSNNLARRQRHRERWRRLCPFCLPRGRRLQLANKQGVLRQCVELGGRSQTFVIVETLLTIVKCRMVLFSSLKPLCLEVVSPMALCHWRRHLQVGALLQCVAAARCLMP